MPTANDQAWTKYIQAKNITFDQPVYTVDATDLKQLTGREPRLLAKFDTANQLPQPLSNAGYTLIPVRNGQYQLVRGNLFVTLPTCNNTVDFQPTPAFPLLTEGRGSGESQYIDQAFNAGLLANFLGISSQMYLTIRGRERTRIFDFQLSGNAIHVESVQIEVDAGYESLHDIILIEAKIGVPNEFNVRQIYYPYRHFSTLVPTKRVRNVFMAYDIPLASYYFYEYGFGDRENPLSAYLTHCTVYRIAPIVHLTVYNLIDAYFQTYNQIVPQSNDLNKVIQLLTLVDIGLYHPSDIADYFLFEERQSDYYLEAAKYLGLIVLIESHNYALTQIGMMLLMEPSVTQPQLIAKILVNSWVFVALIQRANGGNIITDADIDSVIATARKTNGSQRYTGSTITRRRETIKSWLKWMANEIGCFEMVGDDFRLN